MDKAKKRMIRKYVSWGCIAVLVMALAIMPLAAADSEEDDGPQVSILSGSVETGSIDVSLHGGGTLTAEGSVEVTIPTGVKITEFLVENGASVTEGQALAAVDRVSVMDAITQVQESMDYLVEEMADIKEESGSESVKAQAGGRIKRIYAQPGDSVQEVMLRDGALAVLSLDGLMAVSIDRSSELTTGDSVCVILSDDTEVSGRVESNLGGTLVVTVEDEGYAIGEQVIVTTEDGTRVGSGTLYVHNAWKATAYFGTVSKVQVKEESTVTAGKTLFTLTDTEYSAQLESLTNQHREYEELMTQLFRMYQDRVISAPCDGVVSGIDKESIHLLSGSEDSWYIQLLANAPGADPELSYTNYVGQITNILGSEWEIRMNPSAQNVTDYMTDLGNTNLSTDSMTTTGSQTPVTVYTLNGEQWEITSASVGDILLFAWGDGGCVWAIYVSHADVSTGPSPTDPPVTEPTQPTGPSIPSDPTAPSTPDSLDPTSPSVPTEVQIPSGGAIQIPSIGFAGITGGVTQEEEFELFDTEGNVLMTISSGEEMSLTIQLDEQDIGKVSPGMAAEIRIDALKNQLFQGQITQLGASGTNNGGSSKFTVEITLPRSEEMLAGMTATVTIPLYTQAVAALVPSAALVETDTQTLIYTAVTDDGSLASPVPVTTGISDGESVEILSGLEPGATYYYGYYDTLELSTEVEKERSLFG